MNNKYFPLLAQTLSKEDPRYLKWKESLKTRPEPWNKGQTKQLNKSLKKMSATFKRKKIDNFYKWREDARKAGKISNSCTPLVKDEYLSFLTGIILGDGNLQKFPRTELLRITLGTDKPLLWQYTKLVVKKVFNKNPSCLKRTNSNCLDLVLYQKNLSKRLNIVKGARKLKIIKIPAWIKKNKEFLLQLLKGLFEAEGSLSIHLKTCTYNFSFTNKNVSLLDFMEKELKKLNFHPERRPFAVRLRRKKEVAQFKQLINFRQYP